MPANIRKRYISQAFIILIACLILVGPVYFLYQNTRELIITEAGKRAIGVAGSIAKFIEKDPAKYIALSSVQDYSPGNYDEAYYQEMLKLMHEIKTTVNADYIYTEKKISKNEIKYILDGEILSSNNFSPIGSTDQLTATEAKAFDPGISTSSEIINDPVWGEYLMGASPIRNPQTREVIGVVGVDFSAKYISTVLFNIRILLILVSLFLVILVTIFVDKLLVTRNKSINTDYLTNLYSKRYFSEYLKELIEESKGSKKAFCLMMIDIDNFKSINDRFGHLAGDKVLIAVSDFIKSTIRRMDACFRYGGDEFVVLLPDTFQRQAEIIGKRIQHNLQNFPLPFDPEESATITLSIGIAEWDPSLDAEGITQLADKAMYISKNEGRNRITTIPVSK